MGYTSRRSLAAVSFLVLGMLGQTGASAESLRDALGIAYRTNPSIQSQRAQLRATGELKSQALAALLPQINGQLAIQRSDQTQVLAFQGQPAQTQEATLDQFNYGVSGEQLIFDGFRSMHAVKQAAAQIDAAEAQLIGVEQQLLRDVAIAYFDVVRDEAVYNLNRSNVEVLLKQQEQAQVRFRVGEITRTDVAQADARLAGARADLTNASAQLAVSRSRYAELVGQLPGSLEPEPPAPALPPSLDAAKTLGREIAPAVLVARATERASKRNVKIAKGAFSPRATVNADYQFADGSSPFILENENFSYGARVNVPILQGGARLSRIREAKALNDRDRQRIFEAERQVEAQIISAWEQLQAATATIESANVQVEANELALRGVRKEALVGTRTTLDVLNAELELLNAQVALETAKRNEQTATYGLLAAVGMLTPDLIGLETYDLPKPKGILPF